MLLRPQLSLYHSYNRKGLLQPAVQSVYSLTFVTDLLADWAGDGTVTALPTEEVFRSPGVVILWLFTFPLTMLVIE